MPEQTLRELAEEAHAAVAGLQEFIRREVPSRKEIETRYPDRREVHKGAKKRWVQFLAVLLIALAASYFVTISTVSACFLSGTVDPETGQASHPGACGVMPGYDESIQQNEDILEQFNQLIITTEENKSRIKKLEEQLAD